MAFVIALIALMALAFLVGTMIDKFVGLFLEGWLRALVAMAIGLPTGWLIGETLHRPLTVALGG